MKLLLPFALMVFAWPGLAVAAPADAAAIAVPTGEDATRIRVQAALDKIAVGQELPGATAAIVLADGRLISVATGFADREKKVLMTVDAVMPAASIGKTFVSAWGLALERQGRIDLDTPIAQWFGEEGWFARLPNGPDITVRMLLNHSSGLIDHAWTAAWLKDYFETSARDPDHHFPPEQLVGYALDQKPLFAAGQGYSYSDTNYVLAGMILERVSGKSYIEAIDALFWKPLGLKHMVGNARCAPGLVNGYLMEENTLGIPEKSFVDGAIFTNPAVEFTGGGVMSTATDLARWVSLLYQERAFPAPYLAELLTPNPATIGKPARYGLGVNIVDTAFGAAWGHGGTMPYYGSMAAYFPERKIAVAIMANRTDFDRKVAVEALVSALGSN